MADSEKAASSTSEEEKKVEETTTAAAETSTTGEEGNNNTSSTSEAAAASASSAPATESVTHPLASRWALWYKDDQPLPPGSPERTISAAPRKIDSFGTVEEFWSIFNALHTGGVDRLNTGETIYFWREPFEPRWEDAGLAKGEIMKLFTESVDAADKFIERFLMAVLGESLTVGQFRGQRNVVAGLQYTSQKGFRGRSFKFDIWTTDSALHSEGEAAVKAIAASCGFSNPMPRAKTIQDSLKSLSK